MPNKGNRRELTRKPEIGHLSERVGERRSGHPGSNDDDVRRAIHGRAAFAVSDRAGVLRRGDPSHRSPASPPLAPKQDGEEKRPEERGRGGANELPDAGRLSHAAMRTSS